ncbi:hypothetical protein [Methanimicrococcus hongohii]|uniref:hypothetical protein n=1 Tax=Methanimicrococcus hongohii TaxID=3028295 RepID=UPI00292FA728|nr:hypothetical protein [Methanimicrococcus sp. Hf6]
MFVKNRFAIFQASPVCSGREVSVSGGGRCLFRWEGSFCFRGREVSVSGGGRCLFPVGREVFVFGWREVFVFRLEGGVYEKIASRFFSAQPPPRVNRTNF